MHFRCDASSAQRRSTSSRGRPTVMAVLRCIRPSQGSSRPPGYPDHGRVNPSSFGRCRASPVGRRFDPPPAAWYGESDVMDGEEPRPRDPLADEVDEAAAGEEMESAIRRLLAVTGASFERRAQLERALETRIAVEQAKGILAERF